MTRQEAIKILSILKAAYPNSYRGMTKEEANGTVNIWATQFGNIPYEVVSIAVNKIISVNTFPPSINEVKEKIRSLYWEAWQMIHDHEQATEGIRLTDDPNEEPLKYGKPLDEKTLAIAKEIIQVVEPMRTGIYEPTLGELLQGYGGYLCAESKRIEGDSKK